ncbi:contactin-5 [Epargyreus clarus]|uniref:contactin-5 n=1 Tax=Epargyreus clarus TaxID=520877 RepID=UPI003C2D5345
MKWLFYVAVFIYMFYRAVYGAKTNEISNITIDPIKYESDKNFYLPGVQKSIICRGAYKGQKLEWIDPFNNTVKRITGKHISVQELRLSSSKGRVPGLMLVFSRLRVDDSGVWECRGDGAKQNISLCVLDPSQFVDTPTEVAVDAGRSITLSCQARGNPEPRVVWYRNGQVITDDADISDNKYEVMTKYNSQGFEGLLTITGVEPDDSGIYTCDAIQESPFADDCSHTQSMNISLLVNCAPMFNGGNDTVKVYGMKGESVQIVCAASAYPIPTYRWFEEIKDTLSEFGPERIQLVNEGTEAVLTVKADDSTFGKKYNCRASNIYGNAERTFMLLKTEPPEEPIEVRVHSVSYDEIKLQVTWDGELFFPVNDIGVQYLNREILKSRSPRERDWKLSINVEVKPEEEPDSDDFSQIDDNQKSIFVTVPDLEAESDYWIRLRAINSIGSSPWTTPVKGSTVAKPEEEYPNEPVRTVAAKVDSDSFYGIFFAGGIIIVGVGCMFAMRMV